MTLTTINSNPLNDYTDSSVHPAMTVDGLVVDGFYGVTGVIDQISSAQSNTLLSPPEIGVVNAPQILNLPTPLIPNPQGWMSSLDYGGSVDQTRIQFNFNNDTWFNSISLSLLNVPCNWSLWYVDAISGNLYQLSDNKGNPLGGVISGSAVLVASYNLQTPTASTGSNWVPLDYTLNPTEASSIELWLDRNVPLGLVPLSIQNSFTTTEYQVGVQNFSIDLNVNVWDDTFPIDKPEARESPWGFSEKLMLNQNPGANVLGTVSYWKSSPQPIKDAVTCLYVDTRDVHENGQSINTIYLEPLYSGARMNVYYSNNSFTPGVFHGSRHYEQLTTTGSPAILTGTGALLGANTQYISIPNSQLSLSVQNNFSVGVNFTLPYAFSSFSVGSIALWSIQFTSGDVLALEIVDDLTTSIPYNYNIEYDNEYIYDGELNTSGLVLNHYVGSTATPIVSYPLASSSANSMSFIVGSNGTTYSLAVDGEVVVSNTSTLNSSELVQEFYWGYNPSASRSSTGYFSDCFIRQDSPLVGLINSYTANPDRFIDAKGNFDVTRGDYNSLFLARLTETFTGFVGPGSDYYSGVSWTPVQQDFAVQKGYFNIPLCKAKYLKFEITNLSPQPYPFGEDSITQTVQVFPDWLVNYYQDLQNQYKANTNQIQSFAQSGPNPITFYQAIPTSTLFGTASAYLGSGSAWPSLDALNANQLGTSSWIYPNQVSLIADPTSSINTLDTSNSAGNLFNSNNNISSWIVPRFYYTGIHQYKYVTVEQTWKQAYFAGIQNLQVFCSIATNVSDTPEYTDFCFDDQSSFINESLTSMPAISGIGYQASATNQTIITDNLPSISTVSTVQVAGVTSDWISPLIDLTAQNVSLVPSLNQLVYENSVLASNPTLAGQVVSPIVPLKQGSYWPFTDASSPVVDHISNMNLIGHTNSGTITYANSSIWPIENQSSVEISGGAYFVPAAPTVLPSSQFTFLATIQCTSTPEGTIFAFNGTGAPSSYNVYTLYIGSDANLHFYAEYPTGFSCTGTTALVEGNTYRIGVVVSNIPLIGTTIQLYLNGILIGTSSTSSSEFGAGASWFMVGNTTLTGYTDAPSNNYFTGYISEMVLNTATAFTQNQITSDSLGIVAYSNYGLETISNNLQTENTLTTNDSNFASNSSGYNWLAITNCDPSADAALPLATSPTQGGSPNSGKIEAIASGTVVAGIGYVSGSTVDNAYVINSIPENFLTTYGEAPYGAGEYGGAFNPSISNQTWTWIVSLQSAATPRACYLEVLYWSFTGTLLHTFTSTPGTAGCPSTDSVGSWSNYYLTSVAPTNAYYTGIRVVVPGAAANEIHYISEAGLYNSTNTTWSTPINYQGMRVSAVAQVYLPYTANGTYEIRLKINGQIVSREIYQGILNFWIDMETIYLTPASETITSIQAEVVQTNPLINESFVVGMLSYFYHPIRWEISTDGGNAAWQTLVGTINDAAGFISITPSNTLLLRLTALVPGATVSAFTLQPRYPQSTYTPLANMIAYPSPLTNENNMTKSPQLKSMFQLSSQYYPIEVEMLLQSTY